MAPDLNIASDNVFTKHKSNALTSAAFAAFIEDKGIDEFYITGADAAICVKSTCFNLRKEGYGVYVLTDGIASWKKENIPGMIEYYESRGCGILTLGDLS